MKKNTRDSRSKTNSPRFNAFEFSQLKEFRWRRKERLGLDRFIIIEKRPEQYFTEEEWRQYFIDDLTACCCIDQDLPVPEDVEIRLLKAMTKINLYIKEEWRKK